MVSALVYQPLVQSSQYTGDVVVMIPITCVGSAADVTVRMYVYQGQLSSVHGALLYGPYSQDVSFAEGEEKIVEFTVPDAPVESSTDPWANRRDIGVEVVFGEVVVKSSEFDDVYFVAGGLVIPDMSGMINMMMVVMMMGLIMPMMGDI